MESQNSRLLIVCEGETEEIYFRSIIKMLGLSGSVKVLKDARYTAPKSLLEAGCKELYWSRMMHSCPFTEVWLVFDRDHHDSYANVLKTIKNLNEPVFAAWSNPCIEYWFWLHYSRQTDSLKRDEEFKTQLIRAEQVDISGATLRTTVERVWQGMKPETMLQSLRSVCPGYKKAQIPDGILKLTSLALSTSDTVSQSEDPLQIGTAVPKLIRRLMEFSTKPELLTALGVQIDQVTENLQLNDGRELVIPKKPQTKKELQRLIEKSIDQTAAFQATAKALRENELLLPLLEEKLHAVAEGALVLRRYYGEAASEVLRLADLILKERDKVFETVAKIKEGTSGREDGSQIIQQHSCEMVKQYTEIQCFLF